MWVLFFLYYWVFFFFSCLCIQHTHVHFSSSSLPLNLVKFNAGSELHDWNWCHVPWSTKTRRLVEWQSFYKQLSPLGGALTGMGKNQGPIFHTWDQKPLKIALTVCTFIFSYIYIIWMSVHPSILLYSTLFACCESMDILQHGAQTVSKSTPFSQYIEFSPAVRPPCADHDARQPRPRHNLSSLLYLSANSNTTKIRPRSRFFVSTKPFCIYSDVWRHQHVRAAPVWTVEVFDGAQHRAAAHRSASSWVQLLSCPLLHGLCGAGGHRWTKTHICLHGMCEISCI